MLRYVVATLVSLALVTAVSWGADPARPAKLISVTVTGKAELAVVRLGEAIPLVVTIANDLPGPVIFTTFSLKPNDWNGESFSLTLVDITRDGKPGGLFLERPKVDPPVRISGTSGHTIKAGETLSVSSDARKWAIAGGWIPGKYKATVRVLSLGLDEGRCQLSVTSEPFEFEVRK